MADFFAASLGPGQGNVLDWSRLLEGASVSSAQPTWTIPEAFVAVLFGAVTCDGELATVEHEELLALAHRSRALKTLTPEQLGAVNTKVSARLRDSDTALQEACMALPEDMRLPAFAHALDLILADGELNEEEADFLNAIILHLKLNREDVERVADVIVMKNQY
jgi:uncharacterized tellurite resistance protein B-like protein